MKNKYHKEVIPIIFIIFSQYITYGQSEEKKTEESCYFNEEVWTRIVGPDRINNEAFQFLSRNEALPDILIIGNSISIRYTPTVREELSRVANVYRIPENGRDTYYFLENYEKWLSSVHWDIIFLNIGLHDLKRTDVDGNRNTSRERNNSPEGGSKQLIWNVEAKFGVTKDNAKPGTDLALDSVAEYFKENPGDQVTLKYNSGTYFFLGTDPSIDLPVGFDPGTNGRLILEGEGMRKTTFITSDGTSCMVFKTQS